MAVTSADVTPRLDEEPSPESTTAQRSPEPTTAQRTSPKKYARGFLQRRKGQLKLLLNAQLARVLGLTLTVGCGLGLTLLTEFYAPNFWLASDTSDLHRVHYKVEPNVDGLWSLTCDEAKSPGETCAVHLRTRSQFMRFYTYHTADDQARNNYADAPAWVADPRLSPNEIVATSSVLTQWMYYELLRGLTLGSFNGLPTLEVVFEPTERLANALASFHNASNTAGVSDALVGASAAHAMSTHVIGLHLGGVFGGESQLASMADVSLHEAGMPGTNIWRSAMPSHIYSCYASWRGGRRIDRLHNTESWGPTYCEGDGPTSSWSPLLVVYGYLGASALLAVFTSLGTLYVAQKAIFTWQKGQASIMARSTLFAYYHENAGREATRKSRGDAKISTNEIIAERTPIVVMIECAVAAADGDLDNPFTPKEGLQASMLQGLYICFLAVPAHLFAIFCSRDANRTDAFSSAWSMVTVILLLHYTSHLAFVLLHILGAYRLGGPCSRYVIQFYRLVVTLSMFTGMFLITMMVFWLGSTVSYHQGYVIKVLSIIGSFLSFLAILLSSANKFGKRSHGALEQVEAEIDAAVVEIERQVDAAKEEVENAINKAKAVEMRARNMAASIDISGKQLFAGFVVAFILLTLVAAWILAGSYLWAAQGVSLTSTVMPALVAAIKKQADASLGKITEKMPTTTGAIADARKTVDDVVNALETGDRAQVAKLVGKAQSGLTA